MPNLLGDKPPLYKADYKFFEINNLRCLYIQNTKIKRSYVAMGVDCGSQHDTIPGLAHLLEHLLFISPEQDEKDSGTKDMNEFDSFLNSFNGHSNAFTSDEMTVYHYELDSEGLEKSLEIFSDFFKKPIINPQTVQSEIKNVDSEFQNGKYHESYRLWRLQELLADRQFSTGNFNSFGTDYNHIVSEAKKLHEKYYKKMVFVICSELPFDAIKPLVNKNFTLPLTELEYSHRKCLYCENDTRDESIDLLKINKLVKFKGMTARKRVYIAIPLISEHILPFNMYETLEYYMTKTDHTSITSELKNKNLAISVGNYIVSRCNRNILILDLTVDDTQKYSQIIPIVKKHLEYYRKNTALLSEESKMISKIDWQLEEDADPSEHATDCAEHLLRSNILFTDLIREHDCPNITFSECNVILLDQEFDIKICSDEYELYFEEVSDRKSEEIELVDDYWKKIQEKYPNQTKEIKDEINRSLVRSVKIGNSEMVIAEDSFESSEIFVKLKFHFDCTLEDQLNFKIFTDNIHLVYDSLFQKNGISFSAKCDEFGVSISLSGPDPLFILLNIVNRIELDILEDNVAIRELHTEKMSFKYDHGFKRVGRELINLYVDHTQGVDQNLQILESLVNGPKLTNKTSFFNKTNRISMVVAGANDPIQYLKCFEKLTGNISNHDIRTQVQLLDKYSTKEPLNDLFKFSPTCCIANQNILGRSLIKAKSKSTCLHFKFGNDTKSDAIARVLVNALREKFFFKLRTEKSLGYVVYVQRTVLFNSFGVSFNVQSDLPVLSEILQFINDSDFETGNKDAIINEIMTEKLSRDDLVTGYSYLLSMGIEIENRQRALCDAIKNVTSEDLKNALKTSEVTLVESEPFEEFSNQ